MFNAVISEPINIMNLRLFQISNLRTIELKVIGLKYIIRMLNTDYTNKLGKISTPSFLKKPPPSPAPPPCTHKRQNNGIYYLYFDSMQRE